MSWFAKGGDAKSQQFRDSAKSNSIFRFFMDSGQAKEVVFLDDAMFMVKEHFVKLGPKKFETFTCSDDGDCILCGMKQRVGVSEYYTILDLTPYKKKDGTEQKYSRKALPVKGTAIDVLMRRRQAAGGNLKFNKVRIIRDGDKSPNSGSDFEVLGPVDQVKLEAAVKPVDLLKPYEFMEALKPMAPGKIEAMLKFGGFGSASEQPMDRNSLGATDAPEGGSASFGEDDIPF